MNTQDFLKQMQQKCIAKSKQMATLELSVWDDKHESELKKYFGFNDKTLAARKRELQKETALTNGI